MAVWPGLWGGGREGGRGGDSLLCEIVILLPVSQTKGDSNTGTVVVAERRQSTGVICIE